MNKMQYIDPGWRWDENFPLSQGIRTGNLVFLSGQVPFDSDGNVVGVGDLRLQTRQVFENIKGILQEAGAGFQDVVKMTTFLPSILPITIKSPIILKYARNTLAGHKPCSTGVQVSALVDPDLMLEVEVVALLPNN